MFSVRPRNPREPIAFRRLDILYLALASFDLITIIAALALNYAITSAFDNGVKTSAIWSYRQAELVELSRLAQLVDTPGNDVFLTEDAPTERARRDVALRHFNLEWDRLSRYIREHPLSSRDDELLARLTDVHTALGGLVAHSEQIFDLYQRRQMRDAGRRMAEMDRAYGELSSALDRAMAVVEREREIHLRSQLDYARAIRRIEFFMAFVVLAIVILVSTYGWRIARSLRLHQEQRAQMLEELAEAKDRLQHYADDVSHELRGPISKMRLDLEILLSRPRTIADYQRAAEGMLDDCARTTNIVESLLFLARANSDQQKAMKRRIDVEREIALIVDFHSAAAEQSGISISCQFDIDELFADRSLFQRAVNNLISNALAHTPRGGSVMVHLHNQDNHALVDVLDSGVGMSDESRRRALDRFFRDENTRNTNGLGLGLAITKAIMELHGGSVTLLPNPAGGTLARLRFPTVRDHARLTGENYEADISAQ